MENYAADIEIEEDYEIGWSGLSMIQGLTLLRTQVFDSVFSIRLKTTRKISSKLCSHQICIPLWLKKQTNMLKENFGEVSFFYIIFIYTKNVFFQPWDFYWLEGLFSLL